ncbi:Bifunctional transcriptional activator/DNA repair enzyme Ada [Trichoderma lentiforme]|uniref:Bifunctional transcriptional activator/DNA repair enzyme Ada n=1 Tax=Trichoderma lentiforme TaxID=1567552 RepID=A0A9P4XH10_9HYPO|nr:Bifunctional transcriptional activator/DNA repair enzyme Ada [Trichoderma lentiforme]
MGLPAMGIPIPLFLDDDSKWQAVQSRDPDADGFFVYGVRTTKVFCRPTCKARLARRANVRFYATGEEAKQNGFRACKRCKPEVLGLMPEEEAVQKIRAFVRHQQAVSDGNRDMGEMKMSLSQMAKKTGLSKWHFHRVFKKCVGVTPVEYLKTLRDMAASLSPGTGSESGLSWTDQLDLVQLDDMDFDFGFLNDPLALDPKADCAEAPASNACPLFTLDDILVWPENLPTK